MSLRALSDACEATASSDEKALMLAVGRALTGFMECSHAESVDDYCPHCGALFTTLGWVAPALVQEIMDIISQLQARDLAEQMTPGPKPASVSS